MIPIKESAIDAVIVKEKVFNDIVERKNVLDAIEFLKRDYLIINPRKQWPAGIIAETRKAIPKEYQNEIGRVLCNYGDAGWGGKYVKEDKYIHGYLEMN